MEKQSFLTRILIRLGLKKSSLDAWMDREERKFPFSDLLGMVVKCGEKAFTITAEMEKTGSKEQGLGKFGMGFHWWEIQCPFCPHHIFRIGSDLRVETLTKNSATMML